MKLEIANVSDRHLLLHLFVNKRVANSIFKDQCSGSNASQPNLSVNKENVWNAR